MKLRPHHLIDIFKGLGNGRDMSKPHEFGHAQHIIVQKIRKDSETIVEFICENDDICTPCRNLGKDNICIDILKVPLMKKQDYNDALDKRLFNYLKITPGTKMTVMEFMELVLSKMPDIIPIATHPGADEAYTEKGLLNIRAKLES